MRRLLQAEALGFGLKESPCGALLQKSLCDLDGAAPHRLQSSKKIKPDGKMLVFTAGLVELCINRYLLFLVAGLSPAPHRSPRGILFASAQKESKMHCRLFLNKLHKIRHCLLKVYTIPLKLAVFHCKSDALSCVLSSNLYCLFPIVTIHKSANTCA